MRFGGLSAGSKYFDVSGFGTRRSFLSRFLRYFSVFSDSILEEGGNTICFLLFDFSENTSEKVDDNLGLLKPSIQHLFVYVDVTGKCLGGGVVRNTAGSERGPAPLYIIFVSRFDARCPAADVSYNIFSLGRDLSFCLHELSASAAACNRAQLAVKLDSEQLLGLDSHQL